MMVRYDIFDRMYELTKHPDDLEESASITATLATYNQAERDDLLKYAEDLASEWKKAGNDGFAGLWKAFAAKVRRAGQG